MKVFGIFETLTTMNKNNIQMENQMFLNLFSSGDFFVVHKKLLFYYGPDMTIFLTNLIDKYKYHKVKGTLKEDTWFYATHKSQYLETGLNERSIQTCKRKLRLNGLIVTKMMGLPAKEHYSFNWKAATNLLNIIEEKYDTYANSLTLGTPALQPTDEPLRTAPPNIVGLHPPNIVGLNNNNKVNKNKGEEDDAGTRVRKGKSKNINSITSNKFEYFWELYPNKKFKGKAFTEWEKLCKRKNCPTWPIISRAVKHQKETEQWKTPEYIPYAVNWLKESRWLDDPKEMNKINKKSNTSNKSGFVGRKITYKEAIKV